MLVPMCLPMQGSTLEKLQAHSSLDHMEQNSHYSLRIN